MKMIIGRITRTAMLAVAFMLCATSAWADMPTPVAVWDEDFSTLTRTTSGVTYTLNLNSNDRSSDKSTITIDQSYGVKIDSSAEMSSGMTVLFKYSDLSLSGEKTIATSSVAENSTDDRVGVYVNYSNTAGVPNGIWANTGRYPYPSNTNKTHTRNALTSSQTSGIFAFTHKSSTSVGTSLYYLSYGERTTVFSCASLCSDSDAQPWGCTLGGGRNSSCVGAATGMKITAIAVFDKILTEDEMKYYVWPKYTISANTSVSALNAIIADSPDSKIALLLADGVTIDIDESFSASVPVTIASEGSITLSAASQPDASYFSAVDFSGVKGAVKRSWLTPGVVGYNFRSAKGTNAEVALVSGGTWLPSTSLNQNTGSTTDLFADGLSTFSWSCGGTYSIGSGTILNGYLDDGTPPTITLSCVPYETYDVIVYAATDSEGYGFRPVTVNGKQYTWDSTTSQAVEGTAEWGASRWVLAEYGKNALRIKNLVGPLTINGGSKTNSARGGIAAVQIVPTTAADATFDSSYTLTLDGTATTWTGGVWTCGGETVSAPTAARNVEIVATADTALTIDTPVAVSSLEVRGSGASTVTLNTSGSLLARTITVSGGILKPNSAVIYCPIIVADGGAVDLNGFGAGQKTRIAGQGVLKNGKYTGALFSSGGIGNGTAQLAGITLTANAMIRCDNNWGLINSSYNTATLDIGSYTLTKLGNENFWVCNIVNNDSTGTIDVQEGYFSPVHSGKACTFSCASLRIASGSYLRMNVDNKDGSGNLIIGSLTLDSGSTVYLPAARTLTAGSITANGTLKPEGTVVCNNNMTVGGDVVVPSDKTWTVAGTLTVANGGKLEIKNNALIPGTLALSDGGTLKIAKVSDVAHKVTAGTVTTPNSGAAIIDISDIPDLDENGTVDIITATSSLDADCDNIRLVGKSYSLQSSEGSLQVVNDGGLVWTAENGWNGKDAAKYGEVTITASGSTLTLTESLSFDKVTINGSGEVSIAQTASETLSAANIVIGDGVTLNASPALVLDNMTISNAGANNSTGSFKIPVGVTCTMTNVTCGAKIHCYGNLNTRGNTYLNCTSTSGTKPWSYYYAGSKLTVENGRTEIKMEQEGLSGDIEIALGATLVDNRGWDDGLDFNATNTIDVKGVLNMGSRRWTIGANNTINLYADAQITGSASTNGNLDWKDANCKLNVKGNATLNANYRARGSTSGSVKINVDEDAQLTVEKAPATDYSAGTIIKEGSGSIYLHNFTPSTPITVDAGRITADFVPTATVTINENGIFKLQNASWESGDVFAGSGTLELATTWACGQKIASANSTFAGIVKPIGYNDDNLYAIGGATAENPGFAEGYKPELVLSNRFALNKSYDNATFSVRNLSGGGTVRGKYNSTANAIRTIATTQTKDTVFSGNFQYFGSGPTYTALTVLGEEATGVHSLTLTGASETTKDLTIGAYGKVIFSGSGSWQNGTVNVCSGGVLESQKSGSIAATLKVQKGAKFMFADGDQPILAGSYDWSDVEGDIEDSERIKVDISGATPSNTPITIISSGVTIDVSKFVISPALNIYTTPYSAALSVENGALKVTYSGNFCQDGSWLVGPTANGDAKVWLTQNSTLTTTTDLSLGSVAFSNKAGVDVTLTVDGTGELKFGGLNLPSKITIDVAGKLTITGTVSGAGTINVLDGGELTMDGATCPAKITVQEGGKLYTKGTTTLSGSNEIDAGGMLNVLSGKTAMSFKQQYFGGLYNYAYITIDSGAELEFSSNDPIFYNGYAVVNVKGTLTLGSGVSIQLGTFTPINIYPGGVIGGEGTIFLSGGTGERPHSTIKMFASGGDNSASATISCAIQTGDKSQIAKIIVEEGVRLVCSGNLSGSNTITKQGAGTLDLTANASGVPLAIDAGMVVAAAVPTSNVTINENGTFTLMNAAYTADKFSGAGTLELLKTTSGDLSHTVTSTFGGKIKVVRNINSNHHIFGSGNTDSTCGAIILTGQPELEISGDYPYLCLNRQLVGNYIDVKNLSLTGGTIDPVYNNNTKGPKGIRTLQTNDTVVAGNLSGESDASNRNVALYVYGQNETVHSLTLSAANSSYGSLTVDTYGKVVFATGGSWQNGTVTVGANGWLEATNVNAITKLTLTDGANLVFPTSDSSLEGISSITFASGTTTVHFPGGVAATEKRIINWSGASLASAPVGSFVFDNGLNVKEIGGVRYILESETSGLYVRKVVASTTSNDVTSYHSSFASAVEAAGEGGTITVLADAATVTVNPGQKVIVANDVEVGTISWGGGYSARTEVTGDGSTEYVASVEPAIFYWSSTAASTAWGEPTNWKTGSESGPVAGRLPTSTESVVISLGTGSKPTLGADVTVASLTINEGATLTEGSYKITGTLSGSGTLALSAARDSAITFDGWTGTVVLPTGLSGPINFQYYGNSGSKVQVTGELSGYLPNEEINTTIDIPSTASLSLTGFSAGYTNKIKAITGRGTFTLAIDASSASWLNDVSSWGDWYTNNGYSSYLRIVDVSGFTGTLVAGGGTGIQIGDGNKPAANTLGGKIRVPSGISATIPAGATWQAASGFHVDGALTNEDGTLAGGSGLIFGGSGVVTQKVVGVATDAVAISNSVSVVLSGATAKFGTGAISMYDTSTLTYDPGAGNTYTMSSGLAAATTGNKVIVASGTLNPTIGGDATSKAFKSAEIVIENGGELLLGTTDTTGWSRCEAPIRVKTGGILNIARRETMAHDLYLEGGTLKITGLQSDRGLDLYSGRCTIYATEDSTIQAAGDYPIYVRDGNVTVNVAEGKTLTCNCAFVYHSAADQYDANSKSDIIKTGAGTLVLNGQGGNAFALPKGLNIQAGTVEVNTTINSNGQTGDAANFYTVASDAKLKLGASGQVNATTLNLNDRSLLEFGAGNATQITVDTVPSIASGTITISFSGGVTPTSGTKLISYASGLTNPRRFALAGTLGDRYALSINGGLVINEYVGSVTTKLGTTKYTTMDEILSNARAAIKYGNLEYVTILVDGDIDLPYYADKMIIKNEGHANITIRNYTEEYLLSTCADETGLWVTNTLSNVAHEYIWTGEGERATIISGIGTYVPDPDWGNAGNWKFVGSNSVTNNATRSPMTAANGQSDTVVFPINATAELSANVTVASVTLGSGVALTLNSDDGESARTLDTTTEIQLSRGQTITLGTDVTLDPEPTTSVERAKVIQDGNTYKVVYGTIFSVY